jgi:hypothetical protein
MGLGAQVSPKGVRSYLVRHVARHSVLDLFVLCFYDTQVLLLLIKGLDLTG